MSHIIYFAEEYLPSHTRRCVKIKFLFVLFTVKSQALEDEYSESICEGVNKSLTY
jgi:hypothetical protein